MTLRRLVSLFVVPAALALVMAACSGAEDPVPTATPVSLLPTATPDPTATPEVSPIAPYSLSTRDVPFTVALPEGTTGPVFVRVFGVSQWEIARSAELTEGSDGAWTASIALEEGALIRYAYNRGDLDDLESLTDRREAPAIGLATTWRIIHVAAELTEVRDTVAMWADSPTEAPTGSVTGVVTDAMSGLPVLDAEVSVAGVHSATDFDGGFRFDGIAAGEHLVTVHRATGDYHAASKAVTVRSDSSTAAVFEVDPARPITVQIQAILPEDVPADAVVKIYGNAWQAGGHFNTAPGQPEGLRLPVARSVRGREGERVQIALDLHEGQAVSYRYTLAGPGLSGEWRFDGEQAPRSFIASRANRVRVDEIDAFRPTDAVEVILRADVPDNTPVNVPLQFVMGPGHWMTETDDGKWSTVLYGQPGDLLTYAVRLGDDLEAGADASLEAIGGSRSVEVPEVDTAFGIGVTAWVGRASASALADGELAEVQFRVSVPAGTTDGAETLRLIGDRELRDGIELTPVAGAPTLYLGAVGLPPGNYTYEIWQDPDEAGGDPLISADVRSLEVSLSKHVVNDWVTGWSGEVPNIRPRELRFQGGYYLPDFWSPGFAALTRSTAEFLESRGEVPIALSSVWSYGQVRPTPIVESRPLFASSVATPLEALNEQAAEARRSGLPVILAPQFNPEMTPEGASLAGPKSQEWIDAWLAEAERLWLWNASVADEINAEILVLPGPTFHTFDQPSSFPSDASFEDFDGALIALLARVRERYDGRLLLSGAQTDLEAPGMADLVGVTSFDIGHPSLSAFASVEQWRAGYEALYLSKLDPIHDAWELPIFIYQLQVPSTPSADDPSGEFAQARQLEGMLQALANRPWVVGALSWSYSMIEAPELAGDSIRGRLAEAVLSKHYELFNPADIAALTLG